MTRRVLAALGCTALAMVLTLQAEPPAAKVDPKPVEATTDKAASETSRLSREYKQFESLLLNLTQRMEKSPRAEDRTKAEALRKAINLSNGGGVENRFEKLLTTLLGKDNSRNLTTDDLEKASGQNDELIAILKQMLDVLLTDSELLKKQEEIKRLEEALKVIKELVRKEKLNQSSIDGGKVENKTNAKEQENIKKSTESLNRQMGGKPTDPKDAKKPGDPKDAKPIDPKDAKPTDPKDAKPGDPKDAKPGDPKPGDPKPGDPKPGDPKPGDPKPGQPPPSSQGPPPPPPLPGQKQVRESIEDMKKTIEELKKNKPQEASPKIDDAIAKLEEAQKELEKRLKQLREEELERLLANLQGRCERMLAIQIEVYDGTKRVDAVIKTYPDQKPTRAEEQRSQQLSTREGEIVKEANGTLRLLESEGSAVAFAAMMESVRDDMVSIERRLDKYVTNESTQHVEEDVIQALKDMIEALKKAQQDIQEKKKNPPPPPKNGPPPPSKLLDILAELKLIKSLQVQVNKRTTDNGKKYAGEQADDKLIQDELTALAKKQTKLEEMLKDIASGKNK